MKIINNELTRRIMEPTILLNMNHMLIIGIYRGLNIVSEWAGLKGLSDM